MNSDSTNHPSKPAVARFVRFWRDVFGLSQEELAYRLHSSQRHISRIESGHSRPSEGMLLEIANALGLGHRDSNHLLIAAGFAPIERKMDFHSSELKWLRNAMKITLRALDPYPTVLLDSSSNILMVNRGWVMFFRESVGEDNLRDAVNYYDFMFSREGAGNIIANWKDTLSVILMSLTQRGLFSDRESDIVLAERLAKHPSVPADWKIRAAQLEPMASFPVQIEVDGTLRRFLNVSSSVGALGPSAYASEPNLTIQTLYPEDDFLEMPAAVQQDVVHPKLYY